jgi:hypothetical protein
MTVSNLTVVPDGPQLPPISITYGCMRVATVYTWTAARIVLRTMILGYYAGGVRNARSDLLRHRMDRELCMVAAGPVDGMIVAAGPWTWGDSIRAAQEGEHGLGAGDLAYVHDFPNGHRHAWKIDTKCKIIYVSGESHRVTVRITDKSAIQFTPGEIVTVDATRIRRRKASR